MSPKSVPDAAPVEEVVLVPLPSGQTIRMRPLTTARQVIAMSDGEAVAMLKTVVAAVIDPADAEAVLDLTYEQVMDLGLAWLDAKKQEAVPPTSA